MICNSDFIQLCCDLAYNRVQEKQDKLISKGNGTTLIEEDEDEGTKYTDYGQTVFDEYYDYYQDAIRKVVIIEGSK